MTSKAIKTYIKCFNNYLQDLIDPIDKQDGGNILESKPDDLKKIINNEQKEINNINVKNDIFYNIINLDSLYEYLQAINEETLEFHHKTSMELKDCEIFKNYGIKESYKVCNVKTLITFDYLDNMFFKYYIQIFNIYLNMDNLDELKKILGTYKYEIGNISIEYVKKIKFESKKNNVDKFLICKIKKVLQNKYDIYNKKTYGDFYPNKKIKI